MATLKEIEYPSYPAATASRLSWLAIFVGAATSVALVGCLGLLGLSVRALHVPNDGILRGVSTGAGFWLIVTGAIAFYVGGWVASRMAGSGRLSESVIHGFASRAGATVGLLVLFPAIGAVFSPTAISLAPAAAPTFGWVGFWMTTIESVAACMGARYGARLLMPVPVSEYHKTKRQEPAWMLK